MSEHVMCVDSQIAARGLQGDGFLRLSHEDLHAWLTPDVVHFSPRSIVEHDEGFRQIIPYIVIRCGRAILAYTRTRRGGEPRLFERLSIGVGGHISLDDKVEADGRLDVAATIYQAALRELSEEFEAPRICNRSMLGVIHGQDQAVSRVHLGVAEVWEVSSPKVEACDPSIGRCSWKDISELDSCIDRMEDWSAMTCAALVDTGF